jgi:hypothetical protein
MTHNNNDKTLLIFKYNDGIKIIYILLVMSGLFSFYFSTFPGLYLNTDLPLSTLSPVCRVFR